VITPTAGKRRMPVNAAPAPTAAANDQAKKLCDGKAQASGYGLGGPPDIHALKSAELRNTSDKAASSPSIAHATMLRTIRDLRFKPASLATRDMPLVRAVSPGAQTTLEMSSKMSARWKGWASR
jgi:hypothetical protein